MLPTIISIILGILKIAPLAIETKTAIANSLALDPSTPADLKTLLTTTADNYTTAINNATEWLAANPETPPKA